MDFIEFSIPFFINFGFMFYHISTWKQGREIKKDIEIRELQSIAIIYSVVFVGFHIFGLFIFSYLLLVTNFILTLKIIKEKYL